MGRGIHFIAYSPAILGATAESYNYFQICQVDSTSAFLSLGCTVGGFTPDQAYAIDAKMDDGLPATGVVQASADPSTLSGGGALFAGQTCMDYSGPPILPGQYVPLPPEDNRYTLDNSDSNVPNCQLQIRMN
jgi:hypothetical protein